MKKILTISVAACNAEQYISICLDSLMRCKRLSQMDIIVVDDGSMDNTLKIAEAYQDRFPESVRVISKENGGHGSTINTSIRNLRGKYFKILDADDWVESEYMDRLVAHLSNVETDLVCNPYYIVSANHHRRKHLFRSYAFQKNKQLVWEELFVPDMHTMTFNSSIIKKMGPIIDENCYYVDQEYAIFPLCYVRTVEILEYPIYDYLVGSPRQSIQINIKRNKSEEHLKVVKRLTEFYESVRDYVDTACLNIIQRGILSLIIKQYSLYIGMNTYETTQKLRTFDDWLKNNTHFLYDKVPKRIIYVRKLDKIGRQKLLTLYLYMYHLTIDLEWLFYSILF